MPAAPSYRPPDQIISQGDIIRGVPHLVLLAPPIQIIRGPFGKLEQPIWGLYPHPEKPPKGVPCQIATTKGESVSAQASLATGILLDHDCDIQPDRHGHTYRLVALVRTIDAKLPEVQREILRGNGNFDHFYLPDDPESGLAESYVDFSRISCVAIQHIEAGQRLMSLSEEFLVSFHAQIVQFLTRRELV